MLNHQLSTQEGLLEALHNIDDQLYRLKPTELYISDIHGAFDSFESILKTGSHTLMDYIQEYLNDVLSQKQQEVLYELLIQTNQQKVNALCCCYDTNQLIACAEAAAFLLYQLYDYYASEEVIYRILNKYPAYIKNFLKSKKMSRFTCSIFVKQILNEVDIATYFYFMSQFIQVFLIQHIHIVGDIFDRGKDADKVMDLLMALPQEVDIQWGNHDILWLGAYAGSEVCLMTLLRIAARYGYLYDLQEQYQIDLHPLLVLSKHYSTDLDPFKPKLDDQSTLTQQDIDSLTQLHQAIAIIQFKLESQILDRRPEFNMEHKVHLKDIDYQKETIDINGICYPLSNTCFACVNPEDPTQLTDQEKVAIKHLMSSLNQSERFQKHMAFLYEKGSMYFIHNHQLLFHGCIPLTDSGEFYPLYLNDQMYSGRTLLDFFDHVMHQALSALKSDETASFYRDLIWYAWCGPVSPLFGKHNMTTFERYFIEEKKAHQEHKNAYFKYRSSEHICCMILKEFGLNDRYSCMINGHTPVKAAQGESPVQGNGKLFIIDGGLHQAYQKVTGISGYALLYQATGFQLVTYQKEQVTKSCLLSGQKEVCVKETVAGERLLAYKKFLLEQYYLKQ